MYEIQARDARDNIHSVTITQVGADLPRTEFPAANNTDRFIFIDRPGDGRGTTSGFLAVEGVINSGDNSVSLTFTSDDVNGDGVPTGTDYDYVGLFPNKYVQDSSLSADVIVPISEASGTSCSLFVESTFVLKRRCKATWPSS